MADIAGQLVRALTTVRNDKRVAKPNLKALETHVSYLRARGAAEKTVLKHIYCLGRRFLPLLGNKDCRNATRQDIEQAMAVIEGSKLSPETKSSIRAIIKSFYKHLLGEDLYYPKQVAWIKTGVPKYKRRLPEGILTEDDIMKMLDTVTNVRDKAILALLFDSGIRIGELLNLKARDAELASEPAHVRVNGKTGPRKIPILFSVPYLASYLNTAKGRKPDEALFMAIGTWGNLNRPIDRAAVAKMLRLTAAKAKITKPVNPHAFRHARATYYASRLTEQQLKEFFGWTGDSKMASTYVHLSGRDIDNAVMKAYGMAKAEEETKPKLTVVVCQRCREKNAIDSGYCTKCGAALMPKLSIEQKDNVDSLREAIVKAFDDPKLVEELIHAYLEKKRKGKRG